MERGSINKEDVYKNFGWKYEDGDYKIPKEPNRKDFFEILKQLINKMKKNVNQ